MSQKIYYYIMTINPRILQKDGTCMESLHQEEKFLIIYEVLFALEVLFLFYLAYILPAKYCGRKNTLFTKAENALLVAAILMCSLKLSAYTVIGNWPGCRFSRYMLRNCGLSFRIIESLEQYLIFG